MFFQGVAYLIGFKTKTHMFFYLFQQKFSKTVTEAIYTLSGGALVPTGLCVIWFRPTVFSLVTSFLVP